MRLAYITDTHIKVHNPKCRRDNYYETMLNKMNEVIDYCNNNHVDYLLHGGDLFDRPDVSYGVLRDVAILLKKLSVPMYIIAGNHDIFAQNVVTLGRTALGILNETGLVNLIPNESKIILKEKNFNVQLTGTSFSYDLDMEDKRGYLVQEKGSDLSLHIVHGMLMDKPFLSEVPHTTIDQIMNTKADITLSGHYHSGFGIKKINEKYFINPGALARVSATKQEFIRTPVLLILELSRDEIKIDRITLKSVLPSEEVMDKTEDNEIKKFKLMEFTQSITKSDNSFCDVEEILNTICKQENIGLDIQKEVIQRYKAACQVISSKEDEEL